MTRVLRSAVALGSVCLLVAGCSAGTTPAPTPTPPVGPTSSQPSGRPSTPVPSGSTPTPSTSVSPSPSSSPSETAPPATGTGTTQPVVTSAVATAAGVEVTGYVGGVIADGGECLFAVSSGGRTWTASSTSLADAADTACPAVTIAGPPTGAADLTATLTWTATGDSSDPLPVTR